MPNALKQQERSVKQHFLREGLITLILLTGLSAGAVQAEVVQDQAQIGWSPTPPPYDIGGHLRQQLAQTYTAGVDGTLVRIELVVSCDDSSLGNLHVEIQTLNPANEPSGMVLGGFSVDSQLLPIHDGMNYEIVDFPMPEIEQIDGDTYAIVMRGDEGTICYAPRGAVVGSMFAYPRGTGLIGDGLVVPTTWTETADPTFDFTFFTYVKLPGPPDGPGFCDITDATGMPNDWLPDDVPACGCLEDPVFNAHRCWFALPDFVLWRELSPFGQPLMDALWNLLPLNSGLLEVRALETGDSFAGSEVVFDGQLKPGKTQKFKLDVEPYGVASQVSLMFIGPRGDAVVTFEVNQEIVEGQQ